ncbi:recombinase family protein [Nocardia elegans]|uniref:recombinase family protein n=1 Tax=Nocardia elegans TaxID=300029 RepID=UPI001895CD75|nr:recombinase family protein [Nocardia elegans]MBF6449509.1 recombinase family protein [Nocardia elegans]
MANVLGRIRLSRVTDATTSPERQREDITKWADANGHTVIGWAEDLNVSRAVDPLKAPDLKPWLEPDTAQGWDILVGAKLDRIATGSIYLNRVMDWCTSNGKALVSVSENFDLSTWVGRMVANVIAGVAEGELEAIRERNTSAFRHNLKAGKWRGGVPPWGYVPRQDEDGTWRLTQDNVQVAVIREVVERVLAGERLRSIAHDLTSRKVLTPKDRFAQLQGREVKGYEWHSGPLKRSLTSKTLLGYAVTREPLLDSQGRVRRTETGTKLFGPEVVVTNDDGSPVVRAESVLSRDQFERLGAELRAHENVRETTKRSTALGLQVVFCGVCGQPAYRLKGSEGRKPRYRCASAQYKSQCSNRTITCSEADEAIEKPILGLLGDSERMVRVWNSGSDHSAELADINGMLIDLTEQLGTGMFKPGTPQRQRLNERISGLVARQSELSQETGIPAGWVWQPTGEKFSDWWERQDTDTKNVWLRSMNVRLDFKCSARGNRTVVDSVNLDLGDIQTLVRELKPRGAVAGWQSVFAEMTKNGVRHMEITDNTIRVYNADGSIVEVDK